MMSKITFRVLSRLVTISKPINPYTHQFLPEKPYLQKSQIFDKIDTAQKAYRKWRRFSLQERIEKVNKLTERILKDQNLLRETLSDFTGKSYRNINMQFQKLRNQSKPLIANSRNILKAHQFETTSLGKKLRNKVVMQPLGLALIFPYFSEPIFDTMIHLIPCLLSGNGALLRVSDFNHFLGEYFERKVTQTIGIQGLVTDIFFHPKQLEDIRKFRMIKKVIYSGSQPSARKIFELLVQTRFIDCNLFYGGQDCAYVDETADLACAAKQICQNAFYNNGQSYDCIKRLYLHQSIQDQFLQLLIQETQKLTIGDPKDSKTYLGPLAIPETSLKFDQLINDAINGDASCLSGGIITTNGQTKGLFCEPTILMNCHNSLQIVQEQLHAPVLCSQSVANLNQFAVRSSENIYGTGVRIFTSQPSKYQQFIRKQKVGYISMNSGSITNCDLPIEGWKKSGKGKMLSELSYEEYTVPKNYIYELN